MNAPREVRSMVSVTARRRAGILVLLSGALTAQLAAEPRKTRLRPGQRQSAPLTFEANEGQADTAVKFMARRGGVNAYLLRDTLVLSFTEKDQEPAQERLK